MKEKKTSTLLFYCSCEIAHNASVVSLCFIVMSCRGKLLQYNDQKNKKKKKKNGKQNGFFNYHR